VTDAPPRDFGVLLPPGWVRIPLDGSEYARMTAIVAAKAAAVPEPQRGQIRQQLRRVLTDALASARDAGGIDLLISVGQVRGVPIPASCLVSYLDRGPEVRLDRLHAELGGEGDQVSWTEVAGSPAIRRQRAGTPSVDYLAPVPGRQGLLSLSFATAAPEPLAGALLPLFDAIAGSVRWQS